MPLRTKYATAQERVDDSLPPLWKKLINNVKILNSHGGSLWLFFSTKRHKALSRIEKQVHKIKKHLKQTQIFEQFNTPTYSCSEIETFLAPILTTINSRPLCIYKRYNYPTKLLSSQLYDFTTHTKPKSINTKYT